LHLNSQKNSVNKYRRDDDIKAVYKYYVKIILYYIMHNEELHGLYSLPSIVRVIKARRMGWAGHVARMGEVRDAYNILVGRPEGRRPLGRPRRRTILRWILGK
jgi:hypothetical protein